MAKKQAFASHARMFIEDRIAKEPAPQETEVQPQQQPANEPPAASIQSVAQAPAGYHYKLVENRSRRFQFMLSPTDFKNASAKAKRLHISLNEYFNRLVVQDLYGESTGD